VTANSTAYIHLTYTEIPVKLVAEHAEEARR
jgi:hypothetical protein